jgi:hypothetical protein
MGETFQTQNGSGANLETKGTETKGTGVDYSFKENLLRHLMSVRLVASWP